MTAISLRAYAKHRGVTLKAVQKAIESGRIHTNADGKLDTERADAEWARNTGPKARRTIAPSSPTPPPVEQPRTDSLGAGALDYAKARAVIAHYEARLAKIDYEERIKKLINADEVSVSAFNLFRMFRDRMLNIPDRVVGALVAELREAIIAIGVDPEVMKGLDLGKVHGILTAEIRSALEEFADAAHR
jgi:hypothetical protein